MNDNHEACGGCDHCPEDKATPKVETKKFNVVMYTMVVSLDGQMEESFAIEGASTKDAFERFLPWYLVYRSNKFPNLVYQDIDPVTKGGVRDIEVGTSDYVVGAHEVSVPVKNETKEVVGQKVLRGTFSKATFGMLL